MLSLDDHQDIARSSYADMLNDDERNRAYNYAIQKTVTSLVQSRAHNPNGDRFFRCCDIGTGSGLLSMMIVRAFKDLNYELFHISAFEAFKPMAHCAQKVIEANEMSKYITVIPERSDHIDENPQYDLLVAELLDTELIGEGCLEVYQHAIVNLCSPTCLFVPYEARIYIEPVASSLLFHRNSIDDLKFELGENKTVSIEITEEVKNCVGSGALDDMQASALKEGIDFLRFSEPKVVFRFRFNDLDTLSESDHVVKTFPIKTTIKEPPVMVMWWDIVMYDKFLTADATLDEESERPSNADFLEFEVLSCAPTWARNQYLKERDSEIGELYGRDVWRDHWIQAIYYFGSVNQARSLVGQGPSSLPSIAINCYHDSHSLRFDLNPTTSTTQLNCYCGAHRGLSRAQLAFLSDTKEMTKLLASALYEYKHFPMKGEIAFKQRPLVGNTIEIAEAPKWKITFTNPFGERIPEKLVDLSMQDLVCWEKVMARLRCGMRIDPVENFVVKCTQVLFDNLNRIRTDIKYCEGFNMKPLDEMISLSSKTVDKPIETHHLWEYSCRRLDTDHIIFSSDGDNSKDDHMRMRTGTFWKHLRLPVRCNDENRMKGWALVFWAEFNLRYTNEILSSGPISSCSLFEPMEWTKYSQQSVYFMHDHPIDPKNKLVVELDVGIQNFYLTVQRAADYNRMPSNP